MVTTRRSGMQVGTMLCALALAAGCDDGKPSRTDTDTDAFVDAADDASDVPDLSEVDVAEDVIEEDVGTEPVWTTPELTWEPCSLFEGEDDGRATCTTMQAPWHWGVDHDRTFTVAAKKLSPPGLPSAQIWLLEGGPGGSGLYGYPQIMEFLHDSFPSMEIFTLDARGTGHSEFLACPADDTGRELTFEDGEEEFRHCAEALGEELGEDLYVYGTTQSAHDLWAYIEATRWDGRNVLVWSNSAGTFWAHRFLQLHPDSVDGVVLEGLLTPDYFGGLGDEYFDDVIMQLLDLCAADTDCATRLPDPHAALSTLLDDLVAGHCPEIGAEGLLMLIQWLAYYRPFNEAIPGIIHRVARCDGADLEAIDNLISWNFMPDGESGFSIAVYYNEFFSEMWDHPDYPDSASFTAYLDELYTDCTTCAGGGYIFDTFHGIWQTYDEPLRDQWADTDVALLMLQGRLDPATHYPQSLGARDHFTGSNQYFLDFPQASHGVVFGTPTGYSMFAGDCGWEILRTFLLAPTSTLDTSCMADVVPLTFDGTVDAPRYMGRDDWWDNP